MRNAHVWQTWKFIRSPWPRNCSGKWSRLSGASIAWSHVHIVCSSPLPGLPLYARTFTHICANMFAISVAATCTRWVSCTAISSECLSEHHACATIRTCSFVPCRLENFLFESRVGETARARFGLEGSTTAALLHSRSEIMPMSHPCRLPMRRSS